MAALSRRGMILPGTGIELEKVDLRGAALAGLDLSNFCFANSTLDDAIPTHGGRVRDRSVNVRRAAGGQDRDRRDQGPPSPAKGCGSGEFSTDPRVTPRGSLELFGTPFGRCLES